MNTDDFLLELGTEELPPKSLKQLAKTLSINFAKQLSELNLAYSKIDFFATPRRLALLVNDLQLQQDNQTTERKGPLINSPEVAISGFAKSCGVEKTALLQKTINNKNYYYFQKKQAGSKTIDLLESIVNTAISNIVINKPMRWGNADFSFVRPPQWLVMLLGKQIVPATVMGLSSGNISRGLRFTNTKTIKIENAKDYQATLLNKAKIQVDFSQRNKDIRRQIESVAANNQAIAVIDEALLDEVCALVEHPQAFAGSFDVSFLATPKEALISAMQQHQKYFHTLNAKGKLLPLFIAVANTLTADKTLIIDGNQRVIHSRLKDAEFFYQQDSQHSLQSRCSKLDSILFMQKLGSMGDKAKRISILAADIATKIGADAIATKRAGLLCKADLLTDMVGEFADLQGVMGGYYAHNDGESAAVSAAIGEHYHPRFADDYLPSTTEGLALSLADKLDSIVGIYATGHKPTGSKDPYALKRSALGLMRIQIEAKLTLDLPALIDKTLNLYQLSTDISKSIYQFMQQRLKAYYQQQKIDGTIFTAVLGGNESSSPYDFHLRIKALNQFSKQSDAASLIEANKRIANILKEVKDADCDISAKHFSNDFDQNLNTAIKQIEDNNKADYHQKIAELLKLKTTLNAFFDNVMVNDDDLVIRKQRFGLIKRVRMLFLSVADVAHLAK